MNSEGYTSRRDNAANIRELQRYLRYISRHSEGVPYVNLDGVYGEKTTAATRELQSRSGLPVTGETNFETWTAIVDAYNELFRKNRPPKPIFVFPPDLPHMKEGDAFDEIYVLQVMLNRLGKIYENITDVEISGVFDGKTTAAVNDFKGCCDMKTDGKVDRGTWNMIADTYSVFTHND